MNPAASGIAVAMTGASGAAYGLRLLQVLLRGTEPVHLMLSDPARLVLATEADLKLPASPTASRTRLADHLNCDPHYLHVYHNQDWHAPIASGSNAPRAMVICPCTSGTLAAVASGASRSLLERAADVVLKERRSLILVHRETPVSEIHLRHMLTLSRMGAVILPANPGFYHKPQSLQEIIDFIVARILDHLAITHDLAPRWAMSQTNEPA